ncbi:MAG: hypothetical protein JEZ06_01540 [Anaerolineaceae bacterium]|nr:hypothetical protein [Anaerolineaceae bacterium]
MKTILKKSVLIWIASGIFSSCMQADLLTIKPSLENPTHASSQVTAYPEINTWVRIYGDGLDNSGSEVVQTEDGGYLIVGGIQSNEDFSQAGGVMLLKTDEEGLVLWQEIYGGDDYDVGWTLISLYGDGYIIAGETSSSGEGGRDAYMIRVNEEGNELWSNTYGSSLDETITTVLPIGNDGFLLFGNQVDPNNFVIDPGTAGYGGFAGKSDVFLVRTTAQGELLWMETLSSEKNTIVSGAIQTNDGSFYIASSILNFPDDLDDFKLIKLNADGVFLWEKIFSEEGLKGYTIRELESGDILIGGVHNSGEGLPADMLALLLDLEGNIIWKTAVGHPYEYEFGYDIEELIGGEIVLLGTRTHSLYTGNSNLVLAAIDQNGVFLNEVEIDSLNRTKGSSFTLDKNGALVITGGSIRDMDNFSTFLMKFDPGELVLEKE